MSFVSWEFLLLFVVVVPLYFTTPHPWRWAVLLVTSYIFYAASNGVYLVLILVTTTGDFLIASAIARARRPGLRTALLASSLFLNLSLVFAFKYAGFFGESLAALCRVAGVTCSLGLTPLPLPVGISFYTFMEMAYVIDVYTRRIEAEKRPEHFALFVAFFPHLVAGPILRARDLLPQFRRRTDFDAARVVDGLRLMQWGFFKKIVIADRLAVYVNDVYAAPSAYSGPVLMVATVFFAFQIYADFSGYTDIAIGAARVLGFTFMDNFRQPYFAKSIRDFWQRWHISLSTWFKEYLYIPLGGNRRGARRRYLNLLTVFLVSGLWHGANWTFVVWGGLHGSAVLVQEWCHAHPPFPERWRRTVARLPASLRGAAGMMSTFAFVCVAWVFFRAASVSDAVHILMSFGRLRTAGQVGLTRPFGFDAVEFVLAWMLIALLLVFDALDVRWGLNRILAGMPRAARWAWYYAATVMILSLGVWGKQEFIYFQF